MTRVSTSENVGSSIRMLKNRGHFFSSCFLLSPVFLPVCCIAVVLGHPAAINSLMSLKFGDTLYLDPREKLAFFKNAFNSMWV